MKPRYYLIAALIAASVQIYFAAGFIFERATLLKTGQEVLLNTGFVDPRDLFRGHYVQLKLTIESINLKDIKSNDKIDRHQDVYAELEKGKDGFWIPTRLWADLPENPEGPILKGNMGWRGTDGYKGIVRIEFPIDRYFAPKLEAIRLENLRNDRKLGIIVALDDNGNAGIKGITVDGEVIYDEPLF